MTGRGNSLPSYPWNTDRDNINTYVIFSVWRNKRAGPGDRGALHNTHVHWRILWVHLGQHYSRYEGLFLLLLLLEPLILIFPCAGSYKERGIHNWQDQAQDNENTCDQSIYDIPFCKPVLKRFRWLQRLPFVPSYNSNEQWTLSDGVSVVQTGSGASPLLKQTHFYRSCPSHRLGIGPTVSKVIIHISGHTFHKPWTARVHIADGGVVNDRQPTVNHFSQLRACWQLRGAARQASSASLSGAEGRLRDPPSPQRVCASFTSRWLHF